MDIRIDSRSGPFPVYEHLRNGAIIRFDCEPELLNKNSKAYIDDRAYRWYDMRVSRADLLWTKFSSELSFCFVNKQGHYAFVLKDQQGD